MRLMCQGEWGGYRKNTNPVSVCIPRVNERSRCKMNNWRLTAPALKWPTTLVVKMFEKWSTNYDRVKEWKCFSVGRQTPVYKSAVYWINQLIKMENNNKPGFSLLYTFISVSLVSWYLNLRIPILYLFIRSEIFTRLFLITRGKWSFSRSCLLFVD